MIEKLLIIILLGLLGFFIGCLLSKKNQEKAEYFLDLARFSKYIETEIAFKQTKIKDLIANFHYKSELFRRDMQSYDFATVKGFSIKISHDEADILTEFLLSIGKVDVNTQTQILKGIGVKINEVSEKYVKKYAKEKSMYVQLGFLLGISVGILLV